MQLNKIFNAAFLKNISCPKQYQTHDHWAADATLYQLSYKNTFHFPSFIKYHFQPLLHGNVSTAHQVFYLLPEEHNHTATVLKISTCLSWARTFHIPQIKWCGNDFPRKWEAPPDCLHVIAFRMTILKCFFFVCFSFVQLLGYNLNCKIKKLLYKITV